MTITERERGFVWLALFVIVVCSAVFWSGQSLLQASDKASLEAKKYRALSLRKDEALVELNQWREYAARLNKGYFNAGSAAQGEALFRNAINQSLASVKAEIASIQTKPGERGDPPGLMRLQVRLRTTQDRLASSLQTLSRHEPFVVIEKTEIVLARGISKPSAKRNNADRPLDLKLDVVAKWRSTNQNV